MSTAFWVCAAITTISALVSLGFSVAAFIRSDASSRVNSMYAAARSLALTVAAVVALLVGSTSYLEVVALAMVVVQAADAVIGLTIQNRVKTIGPAITSLANGLALVWLYTSN